MNTSDAIDQLATASLPRFPRYLFRADGAVISLIGRTPRTLRPIRTGEYLGFTLSNALRQLERVYLHRLIAEAFHGAPQPGQEARHLDGDKTNNSATNLCWGTHAENEDDRRRHGTTAKGIKNPSAKLDDATVLEMRRQRRDGASLIQLTERFGVSRMTCWRAVTGRLWSHV